MATTKLNLIVTENQDNSITASWNAIPGAVRYHAHMHPPGSGHAIYNEENLTVTSYTSESNLPTNVIYRVSVTAYGERTALESEGKSIVLHDNRPLDVPQNVKATAESTSVNVSWSAVSRATSYDVLFDNTVYSVTSTSKKFTGLKAKTTHTYAVRAKNSSKTGTYSSTQSITTKVQAPAVPTNVKKTATETSATISWGAVSGATGYDIQFNGTTYRVSSTSKTFTGLTAGKAYSFAIRSVNADASSAYTTSMSVATPPKAPTTVSAVSTETSVTVNWSAVSGASGYTVLFNNTKYQMSSSSTSKAFTGLTANTSYSYQVCSKSADGEGSYSSAKTIKTLEKGLSIPTGVSHKSTDNSVVVSWSAVSGATGYDVLFNGLTYPATGTSKEIAGLSANTTYSYKVRSKNANGSVGDYGAVQTVKTTPKAPTSTNMTSNENSVTVSWSAVSGATSYDLLFNGKVYHVTGTSQTVTGLSANTSYSYQVRVNNSDGSSAYCSAKTVKTAPTAPSSPTATAAKYSVTLNWNAVSGATSYDVLFNGKTYATNSNSCIIPGLTPGTKYSYQIRSNGVNGSSSYSAAKTVSTLPEAPAMPVSTNATSTMNSITVTWNAVSGATSYDVLLGNTVYNATGTSRTITGLTPSTNYYYRVRANNAGGSSAYTTEKLIRTLVGPPAVPTNVRATPASDSVMVSWDAVLWATSYELRFNGASYELTSSYKTITGLKPSTSYSYQVRAKNASGTSAYSTLANVKTLVNPPAAPSDVKATATTDSVTISWSAVSGATGYRVLFNGTAYDGTSTSKSITGLEPNTDYVYSVSARNAGGLGKYSNQQTIRTLSAGPEMPTNVSATATMDEVDVKWKPVEDANNYDLLFDDMLYNITVMSARQRKSDEEWIHQRIDGLEPNTTHGYSVRANNAKGSSEYTAKQYVTTDIRKSSGLAHTRNDRTYPDGRRSYMGNDPVNALTGAFLWSYTWLETLGKDGLHFTTMYDSRRDVRQDVLGKKWSHSLNYLLRMDEEYAYFYTPYDDVTAFVKDTENSSFRTVDGVHSPYIMKANEDGTYSVIASDGTEYVFSETLCLNRIIENGFVAYRFQADSAGQIIRIEGRHGAGMNISYAGGRIANVTDAMGNKVSFTYESDRLAAVINPDGRRMSFTYDDAYNLLTISDFSGEIYLTNTYDVQGRVSEQFVAGRGSSYVEYDEENRETSFTDELGNVTRYTYDEAGHITDTVLAGTSIHNTYNAKGQMTEQTDALGNSTQMEYDEYGRMNHVIHPDGTEESVVYNDRNQPVRVVRRDGAVNLYQYDEAGNLTAMRDERGNTSSYTYDENDNLISFTDKSGNVWTYSYDSDNHLEQTVDPDGNICSYTHDAIGRMTSYTSALGRKISYQYSAAGDLLSITDTDGAIIFEYDFNGNRTGMTDRMGNKQQLEYNAMGQVSLATDCLGNEYRFTYDEKGNLITETDPLGYSISRTYDALGNQTSLTDKNGGVTSYYFDAGNHLIQVRDAAGGTVSYTYDCMGQVVSVTDPLSHTKVYAYDQAGRILSETDALEHSVIYTYDEAGNLLTRTDEDGNVASYTYDTENRLTSIQTDAGTTTFTYDKLGRIVSVTDTDGYAESAQYDSDDNLTATFDKESHETGYTYDNMGRITEEIAPDGGKTAYVYDKNGNCVQITDAEGNIFTYEYDANNRMIKAVNPLGQETVLDYDCMGQVVCVTDANDGVTEYSYDGNGNLISEINPLGGKKTYVYDSMNRLTGSTDEEGSTWNCTYDAAGNRTSYTDANGNCWTYAYDANNRLISVTDQYEGSMTLEYTNAGRVSGVTDMEGAVTGYQYDSMGRLTQISDALGHSMTFTYDSTGKILTQTDANRNITEYSYSPTGNLLSVTDPEGNVTVYTYDAMGRVLTKEDSLGNVISYTYDLLGQVTSMTDALGNKTSFTYTVDGRIATVENAEGNVTNYSYDACGNLIRTEDALGNVVTYEYDAMNNRIKECLSETDEQRCITLYQYDKKGRVIKEINPMLEEKAYVYDGNDNMVSITDEEQRETVVTYDLNNKPVSMTYSDGRTAAFRYNKRGELVEMQDWNGTTTMERDSLGRLTGVTDHNGRMTGYTYDAAGNRTGIKYPDGSAAAYAYDRNNRLMKVSEGVEAVGENVGEVSAQYIYDAVGNVVSVTGPDSMASYTYNANRQPVKAAYRFGETVSMDESITYDVMGRIISAQRTGSKPEFARTTAYAYDAIGQLISYQNGETVEAYTYDALGNRTTRSLNGIHKAACQYNALNQLTAMSQDGVTYGFGYDKCGNLTEEHRDNSLVRQYVYDTAGRMILGKNLENGGESAYTYNALDMRVKNVQNIPFADGFTSKEVEYVPDFLSAANNELMAYETGTGSIRTVFGHQYQRLHQNTSSGKTYFQSDIYGSPLFATDGQGVVKQYAERDIWGNLKPGTGILPELEENTRFTTYRYDPVIGSHFAQARFYDSVNGRMMAKDPIKRGLNQYRYCDNDPVDYVDPTGEILNVLGAAGLGGLLGFGNGFLGSAISQKLNDGKVDWKKARGAGAEGAFIGATQAALLASGAGFPAALLANFLGGAGGSAANQYFSDGKIDPRKSITRGLTNAIEQLPYGLPFKKPYKIKKLESAGEAFVKGAMTGAATTAVNYISDHLGLGKTASPGRMGTGLLSAIAGDTIIPNRLMRDPKRGCGSKSPFTPSLGYSSARGYQYDVPHTGESRNRNKFSLWDFAAKTLLGGLSGGLTSVAFYGIDKGIKALKESVWPTKGGSNTKGIVNDKTPALRFADKLRGLSNSKRPNTVAVVRTADGEYYAGYNKAGIYNNNVQDVLDYLGNDNLYHRQCAEVNAISRAINAEADLKGATISIANVKKSSDVSGVHGTYKPPCNVCQPLMDFFGIEDIN